MKKLKNTPKTLLALIARDQAKQLQARLHDGWSPNHKIKVKGRYKPMTLLEYASEKGALRVARALIAAGAGVDGGHFKPLGLAVLFGRTKIVKLLLGSKADPNVRFADPPHDRGLTPLMTAAATGNAQIFDLLLKFGADPQAVTSKGASALSRAVGRGNRQAIERLVRAGCRASGRELYTPVYQGDAGLVRLLIHAGADVNVKRRQKHGLADLSLLETAIQQRATILHDDWLGEDQSRGANEIRARDKIRSAGYLQIIKELLRAGADPKHVSGDMSPIHRAINGNDPAVAKLLQRRTFSR